jgi:hypothetical protein
MQKESLRDKVRREFQEERAGISKEDGSESLLQRPRSQVKIGFCASHSESLFLQSGDWSEVAQLFSCFEPTEVAPVPPQPSSQMILEHSLFAERLPQAQSADISASADDEAQTEELPKPGAAPAVRFDALFEVLPIGRKSKRKREFVPFLLPGQASVPRASSTTEEKGELPSESSIAEELSEGKYDEGEKAYQAANADADANVESEDEAECSEDGEGDENEDGEEDEEGEEEEDNDDEAGFAASFTPVVERVDFNHFNGRIRVLKTSCGSLYFQNI